MGNCILGEARKLSVALTGIRRIRRRLLERGLEMVTNSSSELDVELNADEADYNGGLLTD